MLTTILILTTAAALLLSLASHVAADRVESMGAVLVLTLLGLPAMPLVLGWNAVRGWRVRRLRDRYCPY